MQGFLLLVIVLILVVGGPLVVIWSLNTLFGLLIPYTFWTWLATFFLLWAINPQAAKKD